MGILDDLKGVNFESERLFATQLKNEDAELLFKMYSDKFAMRFRGSATIENIDDALDMVSKQFVCGNGVSKLRLGIKNKLEDSLVGTLLLVKDEKFVKQFEIGLSFGKQHWGKGYGSEVLKMVEEALSPDVNVLKAWCLKENKASVKLFEKANYLEKKQSQHPKSVLFMKNIVG